MPKTLDDLLKARSQVSEPRIEDHAIDPNNVMSKQCATCPWKGGANALQISPQGMAALTTMVLNKANVRCHYAAFSGKAEQKICRGARNLQLRVFHVLGVLDKPIDECWAKSLAKLRHQE